MLARTSVLPVASAMTARTRSATSCPSASVVRGKDQCELVAPQARPAVAFPQDGQHGVGDVTPDRVARVMTARVVDGLEAVQVDEQ